MDKDTITLDKINRIASRLPGKNIKKIKRCDVCDMPLPKPYLIVRLSSSKEVFRYCSTICLADVL
jgi:hypothetical protein